MTSIVCCYSVLLVVLLKLERSQFNVPLPVRSNRWHRNVSWLDRSPKFPDPAQLQRYLNGEQPRLIMFSEYLYLHMSNTQRAVDAASDLSMNTGKRNRLWAWRVRARQSYSNVQFRCLPGQGQLSVNMPVRPE